MKNLVQMFSQTAAFRPLLLVGGSVVLVCGQEAPRSEREFEEIQALQRRTENLTSQTVKFGDFRLLMTPSVEIDRNDNVTLSHKNAISDEVVRPMLSLAAVLPISKRNLLSFNLGLGYDFYLENSTFDALRLNSGSIFSFETQVSDFRFIVRDRFSYIQDPAEKASLAATGRYGGLDNHAGFTTMWSAAHATLTASYERQNFVSSTEEFDYLNRSTDIPLVRVAFSLSPTLSIGLESGASFTAYDQPFLNDSESYSCGVFANWSAGSYFHITAWSGYAEYIFHQTSKSIRASDEALVYGGLSAIHDITDHISYSVSAGREISLGTQADFVEDWYLRTALTWNIIRRLIVTPSLSVESGEQGRFSIGQTQFERFEWLSAGIKLSQPITKKLSMQIKFRETLRGSSVADRGFSQEFVGILLAYRFD